MGEILCRFGNEGCGIEEVVAYLGLLVSLITVSAGVTFARAYIRAASYSKPVVEALTGRVDALESNNKTLEAQAKSAMEVATGRAAVEALVGEIKTLVVESATAHREQTTMLKEHREESQARDELITHTLELVAIRLEPDNGRRDRRGSDHGR